MVGNGIRENKDIAGGGEDMECWVLSERSRLSMKTNILPCQRQLLSFIN